MTLACYYKKLAAPRKAFFCQHLSRKYWPPGHENPACRQCPNGDRSAGLRPGTPCPSAGLRPALRAPSAGQCRPLAGHSVPQCRPSAGEWAQIPSALWHCLHHGATVLGHPHPRQLPTLPPPVPTLPPTLPNLPPILPIRPPPHPTLPGTSLDGKNSTEPQKNSNTNKERTSDFGQSPKHWKTYGG